MQTAGARSLPEEEQPDLSREAVLLQWERKIEAAERRPARFERAGRRPAGVGHGDARHPTGHAAPHADDSAPDGSHQFERRRGARPGRRPIPTTRRAAPARRRRSVLESHLAEPDRIALWAFLLGLFLVAVAAGTAHA